MIRPPPRSTLFPSTTLFRSTQDTAAPPRRRSSSHRRDTAPAVGSSGQAPIVTGEEDPLAHVPASDSAVPAPRRPPALRRVRDRLALWSRLLGRGKAEHPTV